MSAFGGSDAIEAVGKPSFFSTASRSLRANDFLHEFHFHRVRRIVRRTDVRDSSGAGREKSDEIENLGVIGASSI